MRFPYDRPVIYFCMKLAEVHITKLLYIFEDHPSVLELKEMRTVVYEATPNSCWSMGEDFKIHDSLPGPKLQCKSLTHCNGQLYKYCRDTITSESLQSASGSRYWHK